MHTTAEPAVAFSDPCAAPAFPASAERIAAGFDPRLIRELAPSRSLAVKTFILLSVMMFFGTTGNALLDKAMKGLGSLDVSSKAAIWHGALRILESGVVWSGIACLLLYMLSQMLALSRADYSFVMPFTAMSYALVPLTGYLWFGEAVATARWFGIALIVCGVILVSRTRANTTDRGCGGGAL